MMSITAEFEVVFGIQFKMPQNGCEIYEILQWTPSFEFVYLFFCVKGSSVS